MEMDNEKLKIIESNMLLSTNKGWTKLSKTEKHVKFNEFANVYCKEHALEDKMMSYKDYRSKKIDISETRI